MEFSKAYNYIKRGHKMKLPEWGGYWYWDTKNNTITIHTYKGEELDIRETEDLDYTMNFLFRDDWEFAEELK